jgi:serine/threonine protein kinase
VEAEIESLASTCKFLNSPPRNNLLRLHRRDLQIGQLLGQGTFSQVYEITTSDDEQDEQDEEHHHQPLVMKHLRKDLLSKRTKFNQAAADLVLEAEFLARIDHPNIIKLRGWSAEGIAGFGDGNHDGFFILMDRLDLTLTFQIQKWQEQQDSAIIKRRRGVVTHYQQKLRYASQIASALQYLHERNIIYRDLKPDNIGLQNDSIVLFDFGLCRELPETKDCNEAFQLSGVGTRRYMAPEVALGFGYNLKVDVYSFAMVLYELFTQIKPFDVYSKEMHKIFVCDQGMRPPLPKSWNKDLQTLFQEAWAQDAVQRPTIGEVCERLQDLTAAAEAPKKSLSGTRRGFLKSLKSRFVGTRKGSGRLSDMTSSTASTGRSHQVASQ